MSKFFNQKKSKREERSKLPFSPNSLILIAKISLMSFGFFLFISCQFTVKPAFSETDLRAPYKLCNLPYPGTPKHPIFVGLSRVNFYLQVIPDNFGALECHGREEACAEKNAGLQMFPEKKKKWIQELINQYDSYPKLLHPENITKTFSKRINDVVMPFVAPEKSCVMPKLNLVGANKLMEWDEHQETRENDVLTIILKLTIVDPAHPSLAVLTTYLYRPDSSRSNIRSQIFMSHSSVIDMNGSDEDIQMSLTSLANRLAIATYESSPE